MTGRKAAKRANGRRGLPRAAQGVALDLDECGGRALVRRRLENGLRLVEGGVGIKL